MSNFVSKKHARLLAHGSGVNERGAEKSGRIRTIWRLLVNQKRLSPANNAVSQHIRGDQTRIRIDLCFHICPWRLYAKKCIFLTEEEEKEEDDDDDE